MSYGSRLDPSVLQIFCLSAALGALAGLLFFLLAIWAQPVPTISETGTAVEPGWTTPGSFAGLAGLLTTVATAAGMIIEAAAGPD